MDGSDCYTHSGSKGWQEQSRAALFDYSKYEVLRFLLSNLRWWLEEYGFDGFCFAGVTSMLPLGPLKWEKGQVVVVKGESSGMPTLCRAVEDGGFGFDYCLAVSSPKMWTKMLQEPDEAWDVSHLVRSMKQRFKEPRIAYAESHDQAATEFKTLSSWLMGEELRSEKSSDVTERGLALHKMIRLAVLGLGGE
ncbi:GLC3, partial [Symbiodinium pilosum]